METEFIILLLALVLGIVLAYYAGRAIGKRYMYEVMQSVLERERQSAIKKSREVLTGQFSEQLAPYLPDFPVNPSEVRFVGKPVDFIAFQGLDQQHIEEVVFVEVKTGNAKLNATERSLKEAIQQKRVRFEEHRIKKN